MTLVLVAMVVRGRGDAVFSYRISSVVIDLVAALTRNVRQEMALFH